VKALDLREAIVRSTGADRKSHEWEWPRAMTADHWNIRRWTKELLPVETWTTLCFEVHELK
jgi:hypothetical protein